MTSYRTYKGPTTKKEWYTSHSGNRYYLKSSWELKYAEYLDSQLVDGKIAKWEYEPDVFWFERIKRGVRSYTPDFKVEYLDGKVKYHEVKGYLDSKSKTKLNRMRIYHPDVDMVLVDRAVMKELGLV